MLQTVSKKYITQTRYLFHCHIKIKIPAEYNECILEECFAILIAIDQQYNSYQKNSFFSKINANAGAPTPVDTTTIQITKQLLKISKSTKGAYDITAMPLLKLWGFYKTESLSVPTEQAIHAALQKVNYQYITINDTHNTIGIHKEQEIITGSFIKAYAVDCVVKKLKSEGITDAIINAGGSTIYALADKTHPNWKIHIPNPVNPKAPEATILLSNNCFSLSASSSNYITIGRQKYGHIINASTGYPATNLQVGVISESAFLGDAISTSLYSINSEKFDETTQELQKHFSFGAYLIDNHQNFKQFNFNS